MRWYARLALGFVAAAAGACGSDDDAASASVPPFAGPVAPAPDSESELPAGSPPDDTSPAMDPDVPASGSSNEGVPSGAPLDPSSPAPSAGSGDGTTPPAEPPSPEPPSAEQPPPEQPSAEQPSEPTPPEEPAQPLPAARTQVFLLFGQSNMWGVPAPQAVDLEINPRVEVLTATSCGRHGVDQWVPAQPPLHGCVGQPGGGGNGPGLGPGDYFAKTLAEAFPEDTILLVPNAIPGVSIDVFQPGQQAYTSMVTRARMAQQRGEIRGIIFHQGESDAGQNTWPARVRTVVDQLRSDLGIGEVPFVAGEVFRGCGCATHNPFVNQLPGTISNAFVASSEGFGAVTNDGFGNLHFDLASQREFGRRYAALMLDALGR